MTRQEILDDIVEELKVHIPKEYHDGTTCKNCGHYIKVYKRKISSTIAKCLLHMLKEQSRNGDKHINIQEFFLNLKIERADLTKTRWWGLISSSEEGYWRLTEKGKHFIKGKIKISKYVYEYSSRPIIFSGPLINITNCLGEKFDWNEMMNTQT